MQFFQSTLNGTVEREEWPLEDLSRLLQVSMQTIVRWADRHLIDAELGWSLTDDNEEVRVIHLRKDRLDELKAFATEYRQGRVTRTEARHILKVIDRRRVKKMVRAGDIETVQVDDETKVLVGSIEDYLINVERERADA